jgi:hypothetical protein
MSSLLYPTQRIDLVGNGLRAIVGSEYLQDFRYYAAPPTGQFVGQVVDIPAATPTYSVQIAGGSLLIGIPSLDSTLWAKGDFVLVEQLYGIWKIVNPGAALLEDVSGVTRIHAQVRQMPRNRLIVDLDSDNASDVTKGRIDISPDADTTMTWKIPADLLVGPGFTYSYDCFFYYGSAKYKRQYGSFEISDTLTV